MDRDEIELGDKPIAVERRSRSGVVVSVRLSAEEADQLQALAEQQSTTLSAVARAAITGYLHGRHAAPGEGYWTVASGGLGPVQIISRSVPTSQTKGTAEEGEFAPTGKP